MNDKMRLPIWIATCLAACALVAWTPPVAAQECGVVCLPCGPPDWGGEGVGKSPRGVYNMLCLETGCHQCETPYAADAGPSGAAVLEHVRGSDADGLRAVVAKYSDRLLLDEDRRLLAVRGLGCKTDQVTATGFLGEKTVLALTGLGVGSLANSHVASVGAGP